MSISPGGLAEQSGSGSIAALNGAVTLSVPYASTALMSITGTWVGTLTIEGSVNGTDWFQWVADNALTGSRVQSVTSNARLWIPTAGTMAVRIRASSWTSGTAAVVWNADSGTIVNSISAGTKILGGTDGTPIGNRRDALRIIGADEITDAGQRLRVSNLTILDALTFYESPQSLKYSTLAVGGGTLTHNTTTSSLRLATGTGATDSIIWQTKRYFNYTAGVSHIVGFGVVIGAKKTNVRQRIGYFDANNGIFIEQDSANTKVVLRSNTSGSPVDTAINQSSWNIDKLDGTGASGIVLDTSKLNIYVMDYMWHGAGTIRFGIRFSNTIVYFHEINNANVNLTVFMRRPSLPVRAEVTNTGATASPTTMDVCSYVISKETIGDDPNAYFFTASTGITEKSINNTTPLPLISLRPRATFSGVTNHVAISVEDLEILTIQDSIYVRLVLNGTLTGASWNTVNTFSAAEFDTSATAVTGGTVLFETYVAGGGKGGGALGSLLKEILLGIDINGVQDTVTIAAAKINGNSDTLAVIGWSELQ